MQTGFPVELGGATKMHAVPAGPDRKSLSVVSVSRRKSGESWPLGATRRGASNML